MDLPVASAAIHDARLSSGSACGFLHRDFLAVDGSSVKITFKRKNVNEVPVPRHGWAKINWRKEQKRDLFSKNLKQTVKQHFKAFLVTENVTA